MSEAKRYNSGKPKLGYFARSFHKALEAIARVKEFGATKYEEDNWKLGNKPDSEYLDSMARHLDLFQKGEQYDEDSGCHHLGHAIWNLCALFELNHGKVDVINQPLFESQMKHWADKKKRDEVPVILTSETVMPRTKSQEFSQSLRDIHEKKDQETAAQDALQKTPGYMDRFIFENAAAEIGRGALEIFMKHLPIDISGEDKTRSEPYEGTTEVRCALDYFGNKLSPTDLPDHPYVDGNGVPLKPEEAEKLRNHQEEVFKRVLDDVPYLGVGEPVVKKETSKEFSQSLKEINTMCYVDEKGNRLSEGMAMPRHKAGIVVRAIPVKDLPEQDTPRTKVVGSGTPPFVDGNGNPLTLEEAHEMKEKGLDIFGQVPEPDEPQISHSYTTGNGTPISPQIAFKRQQAGLPVKVSFDTLSGTDKSVTTYIDGDGKPIPPSIAQAMRDDGRDVFERVPGGSLAPNGSPIVAQPAYPEPPTEQKEPSDKDYLAACEHRVDENGAKFLPITNKDQLPVDGTYRNGDGDLISIEQARTGCKLGMDIFVRVSDPPSKAVECPGCKYQSKFDFFSDSPNKDGSMP